mmetsp:Transcript_23929/g.56935  ORF Transcript_23929/g.56935 Transcript_23929/m.56935 type:complete len:150 (+) Transcript_23929:550-999(+)
MMTALNCVAILLCLIAAQSASLTTSKTFLILTALWDAFGTSAVVVALRSLSSVDWIPLNIDHFTERMGCLIMVILGESVVSALFDYRRRGLEPNPCVHRSDDSVPLAYLLFRPYLLRASASTRRTCPAPLCARRHRLHRRTPLPQVLQP